MSYLCFMHELVTLACQKIFNLYQFEAYDYRSRMRPFWRFHPIIYQGENAKTRKGENARFPTPKREIL